MKGIIFKGGSRENKYKIDSHRHAYYCSRKILANARAFVSGRYHPAILASLGGTPCVFMASNSHKTKSLQELLKYENVVEYPVLPSDEEIMSIVQDTSIVIQGGDETRDKIRNRAKELCDNAQTISELIK